MSSTALTDSQKLDILWKYVVYNAQPTKPERNPFEEYVPFLRNVHADQIFYQSAQIPIPATSAESIVEYYNPLIIYPEDTLGRTWFCLTDNTKPWSVTNCIPDWISWEYDPSYEVRIFSDKFLTNRILPNALGNEWHFDYKYGVLTFLNGIPTGIPGLAQLYLVGFRYIGAKSPILPAIPPQRFHYFYSTPSLVAGKSVTFALATGQAAIMINLSVSGVGTSDPSCLVQAHSTPAYNDTNPYAFKAVPSHTTDDGSWVSYGSTFYGVPYVNIVNGESPATSNTYWKITKNGGTGVINLSVTVQVMV